MKTHTSFIHHCIHNTLSGLRDGLSLFSGISRVALIYAVHPDDTLKILDPQNLLSEHQPKLKAIYSSLIPPKTTAGTYQQITPLPDPQLDGVICEGGNSPTFSYQMWFTDHHPDLCSNEPTRCWLRHAILRLSHDVVNKELYTGISGKFLREYTICAVQDSLLGKHNIQFGTNISVVLDAILAISKTNEEGQRPFGSLSFITQKHLAKIHFISRFSGRQLPLLVNAKHVRKLLQTVEHSSNNTLISNGNYILGISHTLSQCKTTGILTANFQGRKGFLSANGRTVCSFYDGNYSSKTFSAKLVEVEEALLDFNIPPKIRLELFQITATLVHTAEKRGHGCGIVLDLSFFEEKETSATTNADTPKSAGIELAGQAITPPLDLRNREGLELAAALSHVDGAIHIRSDLKLHSFACLLDGFRIKKEDRARGARYNSALRFTAQHPECILVVVSSDGAVSVFQNGEVQKRYPTELYNSEQCQITPISLMQWLTKHQE